MKHVGGTLLAGMALVLLPSGMALAQTAVQVLPEIEVRAGAGAGGGGTRRHRSSNRGTKRGE